MGGGPARLGLNYNLAPDLHTEVLVRLQRRWTVNLSYEINVNENLALILVEIPFNSRCGQWLSSQTGNPGASLCPPAPALIEHWVGCLSVGAGPPRL